MAPRLLTLLAYIETAFANHGSRAVSVPPSRSVNFHKSLARMIFADGSGSILLQNFTLADGQICVRAEFSWKGTATTSTHSIYPQESYDWLAGQTASPPAVQTPSSEPAEPVMEPVAATG